MQTSAKTNSIVKLAIVFISDVIQYNSQFDIQISICKINTKANLAFELAIIISSAHHNATANSNN